MSNDDAILTSYIKKLEEENAKLRARRTRKIYLFENRWWDYNGWIVLTLSIILPIFMFFGSLIYLGITSVQTGNFYVDADTVKHTEQVFYRVYHEIDGGPDDLIAGPFNDMEQAYDKAEKSMERWQEHQQLKGKCK